MATTQDIARAEVWLHEVWRHISSVGILLDALDASMADGTVMPAHIGVTAEELQKLRHDCDVAQARVCDHDARRRGATAAVLLASLEQDVAAGKVTHAEAGMTLAELAELKSELASR